MCSTPLWWAMVNVGANLAHNNFSPGVAWFAAIPGWGTANQAYVNRVGRRDRHGADRPGDLAVWHLASHRRDLAWVNQAWLRS